MDWIGFASAVASGALGGVVVSAVAVYLTQRAERNKELVERRHRIYMMLIDLYHQHFWISTNDMHKTEITPELKDQFQKAKYRIMDELRAADGLKQLDDIMNVLTTLLFKTETDRAVRLRQVIDDLGKDVNPRFLAAAKKTDQQNMKLMVSDQDEYWERRSKLDPFFLSRATRRRLSQVDTSDEDALPEEDAPSN